MMYFIKLRRSNEDVIYATIEPTLVPEGTDFCVTLAWTESKGEAALFRTQWHAKAVARALRKSGHPVKVVAVRS
jgi:hypothetical protein